MQSDRLERNSKSGLALLGVLVMSAVILILLFAMSQMTLLKKKIQKGVRDEADAMELEKYIRYRLNDPADCAKFLYPGAAKPPLSAITGLTADAKTYVSSVPGPGNVFRNYTITKFAFDTANAPDPIFTGKKIFLIQLLVQMKSSGRYFSRKTIDLSLPVYVQLSTSTVLPSSTISYCYTPFIRDDITYEDLFCLKRSCVDSTKTVAQCLDTSDSERYYWDPTQRDCFRKDSTRLIDVDYDN